MREYVESDRTRPWLQLPPPSARSGPLLLLVALSVTLGLQAIRILFPLAFSLGERTNFIGAGGLVLMISLAPFLTPLARRFLGDRRLLPAAVGSFAALRLAEQVVHPIPFWLAAIATGSAFVVWTVELLALRRAATEGCSTMALGLILGLSLDAALRSAFFTWDYGWQDGPVPMSLALSLSVGLAIALVRSEPGALKVRTGESLGGQLPIALLGPFLMLQVLFLQNIAFVASQAGLSLPWASALVLVGDAMALATAWWAAGGSVPAIVRGCCAAALVAVAFLLRALSGTPVAFLILVGDVLSAGFIAMALGRGHSGSRSRRSALRTSVSAGLGSFGFIFLTLVYQIHYQVPLPFPNTFVPPAAAALISLGGIGRRAPSRRRARLRLVAAPLALLVVPLGLLAASSDLRTEPGNGRSFRLVDYNVRSSVNVQGQLDPEAIARLIAAEDPDVVVLQEVARGWAVAGNIDLAQWLSRRLRMPYLFAPAADGQFGNAILSRLPIRRSNSGPLPFGAGPQRRSFILAEVDVGDGRTVNVIGTHLQNTPGTPTRIEQIEALLGVWGGAPHTVIAGDMNTQPYEQDIKTFEAAGLTSAQDLTGHGQLTTSAQPKHPVDRVDWIFGTRDLQWSDFEIVRSFASDHLPLAVTVSVT